MVTRQPLPSHQEDHQRRPSEAERILRALGITGKLIGFRYTIYMIEQVAEDPDRIQLITKRLYPETASRFGTSPVSVERSLRSLIRNQWEKGNRSILEGIAGARLSQRPTNTEFVDMLAGYLRNMH